MMGNIVHRCILSGYVSNMILAQESEKILEKWAREIFLWDLYYFFGALFGIEREEQQHKKWPICAWKIPLSLIHFQADWNECINRWPHQHSPPFRGAPVRATLRREMRKIEIMNELRIAQSDHVTVPCTGNQTTIFEKERKNYQWKWNFNAQIET